MKTSVTAAAAAHTATIQRAIDAVRRAEQRLSGLGLGGGTYFQARAAQKKNAAASAALERAEARLRRAYGLPPA